MVIMILMITMTRIMIIMIVMIIVMLNDDDNKYDNAKDENSDQTTIFQTMQFREYLISGKPKFLALTHV